MERLIQDQNLQLGIAHGRKYSGGIDEIPAAAKNIKHILERSSDDVFEGLLDMIMRYRLDYPLGYPVEARYLASQKGYRDDIVYYPVAEMEGKITLGHVGCPDNPWGREIIERVNSVLRKNRATPEFLEFYESWLDAETAKHCRKTALDYFAEE
ncbi:MAG: hypothetical protein QNJ17_13320 [Desulfocapsaceae bacterium]|nr:hypothetical protein [Desulfocapsaceae bacterium]